MLAHERLIVVLGAAEGGKVIRRADVAEDDAGVADEAAAFDAEDGAPGETAFEFLRGDLEQGVEFVARIVASRARGSGTSRVVWAKRFQGQDVEAFVAAVNAVADERAAGLFGDGALEFRW